jgi:predicted metal-dependent HD superfamily phosphohydrolase
VRSSAPAFGARHAPLTLAPDVERALVAAYREPHRAYHNATHIAEVLGWFDFVGDRVGWRDLVAVYLAVVFHDAVYDPTRHDNEARSAQRARDLAGAPARTTELILLTARHGSTAPGSVDADAAHFLDCDAAILGASGAAFDAYDAAIAAEYVDIPADAFRAGRRRFLDVMLARPRIFLSELFHDELEDAARANLARARARYGEP